MVLINNKHGLGMASVLPVGVSDDCPSGRLVATERSGLLSIATSEADRYLPPVFSQGGAKGQGRSIDRGEVEICPR